MQNTYVQMYFRVEDIIKKLLQTARSSLCREYISPMPVPEVFYLLSATRVVAAASRLNSVLVVVDIVG